MPLIIPAGFGQVVVSHALAGDSEPIVNTFGINLGIVTPDTALCDLIFDAWFDAWGPVMADDYSITAVDIYFDQGVGGTSIVSSSNAAQAMSQSGAPLPQNCSVLVRKRTDTAGRRGRGRFYLAGPSEADVGPTGDLTAGYQGAWQNAATELLDALDTIGTGMVILHRSEGAGTEPPPTPVLALVVETKIATQRQRLRR